MRIKQRIVSPWRTRSMALGGAAIVTVLALTSCTSAVDQASGGNAAGSPKSGGTLQIVQGSDIQPATIMSQNNPNLSFNRLVFNTLISYDHTTLKPQPELATSWTLSPDGTHLTFKLRNDVKFQDGRPFTSADVIASIKVVQRDAVSSQMKSVANLMNTMSAPDKSTVDITLDHPASNVFDLFIMMPIIDNSTVDQLLEGKTFNGTGPFKVEKYTPGQSLDLVKNKNYWKKSAPYLNGVDITIVRDSQSMLASLKSGQSQLAMDLAPLDVASVKNDPSYKVVASDAADSTFYVASNVTVPLLSDKKVREAISYAIDRKRVLDQVLGGLGETTSLPWSPASPAFDKKLGATYTYDLAKAKTLLAEAGAAGKAINIYYDAALGANKGIAEIVQYNLTQAGLKATAVPQQGAEFHQNLISGGLKGLFVAGHGFGQLNPVTLVKGAFPFNVDKNASLFDNAEYKALADQLWREPDPSAQAPIIAKLNAFLLDQQFVNDLVNSSHTFTISTKLQGLQYTMLDRLNLDEAYLK